MELWTKRIAMAACAGAIVRANPAHVPEAAPAITPAALLPRVNEETLGWYSFGTVGAETIYSAWAYDADETTYTYSSTWLRRCAVGSTCSMYTSCSNGYMVGASTSSYCGAGGASGSLFCSNHALYTSKGASQAYSWYWCDNAPLTGVTFFQQEPAQPSVSSSEPPSTSASTTRSDVSSTSTSSSSTAASTLPAVQTTIPASEDGGSSTNIGAIAGGVVGGVILLALVGLGVFFLLRRSKTKHVAGPSAPAGYAPAPFQPGSHSQAGHPSSGYPIAYQTNEAKPQGVQEMGGYYIPHPPTQYPQGPYDPYMSYGGTSPLQQATSQSHFNGPVPQELPTQR